MPHHRTMHSHKQNHLTSYLAKIPLPPNLTTMNCAPNIIKQEKVINHIINISHFNFDVDRVFIDKLRKTATINKTQVFIGFTVLSPSITRDPSTKPPAKQLATIENTLAWIPALVLIQDTTILSPTLLEIWTFVQVESGPYMYHLSCPSEVLDTIDIWGSTRPVMVLMV